MTYTRNPITYSVFRIARFMRLSLFARRGSDMEQTAREAEVAALIARALDPTDPYDGHHGNDRSDESLDYAQAHNPDLARRIEDNILTEATE